MKPVEPTECIEYGGKREHLWDYCSDKWVELIELPPDQWPSGIMSFYPEGLHAIEKPDKTFAWMKECWHFVKISKCTWCGQLKYDDDGITAEQYYARQDAQRARR